MVKVKKLAPVDEPKKLTDAEFEKLERFRVEGELRKKELDYLEAKNQHVNDQEIIIQLMQKNLEVDRLKLAKERETLITATRKTKEQREQLMETIKERLELKGRFGYDPDTLVVVTG